MRDKRETYRRNTGFPLARVPAYDGTSPAFGGIQMTPFFYVIPLEKGIQD